MAVIRQDDVFLITDCVFPENIISLLSQRLLSITLIFTLTSDALSVDQELHLETNSGCETAVHPGINRYGNHVVSSIAPPIISLVLQTPPYAKGRSIEGDPSDGKEGRGIPLFDNMGTPIISPVGTADGLR